MNKISYAEEEEPIVLSKAVMDLLLQQEKPADLIALYCFYYYTAKWQKTNITKAINPYVAKAFNCSEDKISRNKQILIKLGLIENIQRKNESNKEYIGNFVKVNFLWSRNHPLLNDEPTTAKIGAPMKPPTNALNTNSLNALSSNKEEIESANAIYITPNLFEEFWRLYPNKSDKGKALTSWNKLCSKKKGQKLSWRMIRNAVIRQKKTERWKDGYIPLPATWLNQSRWLDDPEKMKSNWKENKETQNKFEPIFSK